MCIRDRDYSLVGDVKQILQALLPLVKEAKHTEWMTQIQAWQAQDYRPKDDKYRIRPHQLIGKMCELAGPDALYVTDVGQHQMCIRDKSYGDPLNLGLLGMHGCRTTNRAVNEADLVLALSLIHI